MNLSSECKDILTTASPIGTSTANSLSSGKCVPNMSKLSSESVGNRGNSDDNGNSGERSLTESSQRTRNRNDLPRCNANDLSIARVPLMSSRFSKPSRVEIMFWIFSGECKEGQVLSAKVQGLSRCNRKDFRFLSSGKAWEMKDGQVK
jgi:hypothetical protein